MIKKRAVHFPDAERYKIFMSENCKDFISKLLEKDPNNRLGSKGGINELLSHPWLASINKEKLLAMQLDAPYKPKLSKNLFDVSAFDQEFTSEEAVITMLDKQSMNQINQAKDKFS